MARAGVRQTVDCFEWSSHAAQPSFHSFSCLGGILGALDAARGDNVLSKPNHNLRTGQDTAYCSLCWVVTSQHKTRPACARLCDQVAADMARGSIFYNPTPPTRTLALPLTLTMNLTAPIK